jgi:polar amino acid transport system substrate-binding protein
VLVAQLTATVTSSKAVERLQSSIQGPKDLPGKTIGTVPGSVAADYLTQLGLSFIPVTNADDGIRMLTQGDVPLLSIYADGTYEDIYARWFSRGNQ